MSQLFSSTGHWVVWSLREDKHIEGASHPLGNSVGWYNFPTFIQGVAPKKSLSIEEAQLSEGLLTQLEFVGYVTGKAGAAHQGFHVLVKACTAYMRYETLWGPWESSIHRIENGMVIVEVTRCWEIRLKTHLEWRTPLSHLAYRKNTERGLKLYG